MVMVDRMVMLMMVKIRWFFECLFFGRIVVIVIVVEVL